MNQIKHKKKSLLELQPTEHFYIDDNKYIISKITEGGMGRVICAYQAAADTGNYLPAKIALKILKKKALSREETNQNIFLRELKIWSLIKHVYVVNLISIMIDVDESYVACMPYYEYTLRKLILMRNRNEIDDGKSLINAIGCAVDALSFAERKHKVFHLDLKPENILIKRSASYDGARDPRGTCIEWEGHVSDWGIATLKDTEPCDINKNTSTNFNLEYTFNKYGTEPYKAPERTNSCAKSSVISDIFSLGIILYESALGELPYNVNKPISIQLQSGSYIEHAKSRLHNKIGGKISDLILGMIEPDPTKRISEYASCSLGRIYINRINGRYSMTNYVKFDYPKRSESEKKPFIEFFAGLKERQEKRKERMALMLKRYGIPSYKTYALYELFCQMDKAEHGIRHPAFSKSDIELESKNKYHRFLSQREENIREWIGDDAYSEYICWQEELIRDFLLKRMETKEKQKKEYLSAAARLRSSKKLSGDVDWDEYVGLSVKDYTWLNIPMRIRQNFPAFRQKVFMKMVLQLQAEAIALETTENSNVARERIDESVIAMHEVLIDDKHKVGISKYESRMHENILNGLHAMFSEYTNFCKLWNSYMPFNYYLSIISMIQFSDILLEHDKIRSIKYYSAKTKPFLKSYVVYPRNLIDEEELSLKPRSINFAWIGICDSSSLSKRSYILNIDEKNEVNAIDAEKKHIYISSSISDTMEQLVQKNIQSLSYTLFFSDVQ